jgi:signal transduction histidine kinase
MTNATNSSYPPPDPAEAESGGWERHAHAHSDYWRGRWGYPRSQASFHHRRRWRGPRVRGPMRRPKDGRVVAGVCSAVANRLGLDLLVVRVLFVIFVCTSGAGLLVYVVAWAVVPAQGEDASIFSRAIKDRRGIVLALSFLPLLVVTEILATLLRVGWVASFAWFGFAGAAGLVLVWRNADENERVWMHQLITPALNLAGEHQPRWRRFVRVILGVCLFGGGLALLIVGHKSTAVLKPIGGAMLVVVAFVVVFGPWWYNIARDLIAERQARARAEERAEMASRVHDSVLQTLALIQRSVDDPQHVIKLARSQERELRAWLFEGRAPGDIGAEISTFSQGIGLIESEVEEDHGTPIHAVYVGDCPLTEDLRALLGAAKEATVNAAKWSGADEISLFAEVEKDKVTLFVRDRGKGFDPADVPADRQGIAQSIRARMDRYGGSVQVRSAPGAGAEVELSMPRRKVDA